MGRHQVGRGFQEVELSDPPGVLQEQRILTVRVRLSERTFRVRVRV